LDYYQESRFAIKIRLQDLFSNDALILEIGKTFGRKKNRKSRVIGNEDDSDDEEGKELEEFVTQGFAGKVRPPQNLSVSFFLTLRIIFLDKSYGV